MNRRPADRVLVIARDSADAGRPAMLVTIAAAKGSTPRVPGTRMLVLADGIVGSVGGGQLEFEIIAHARQLMADNVRVAGREHFILGPDLRQCCGGALDVVLEPITPGAKSWLSQVIDWDQAGLAWESSLVLGQGSDRRQIRRIESDVAEPDAARLRQIDAEVVLTENGGAHWPLLYLFGAGHVGRALVNLLADLPYHVIWSDGRADIFPPAIPDNVLTDSGAMTAELIKEAPADAHFLVMTHSHALDFEIVQAILQRGRFASLGLIGSATKKARFVQRLREADIPDRHLARLQCPIGIAGIKSKVPAAIAISVVADLLLLSESILSGQETAAAGVQLRA